jgi:hypothetical protein
MKLAQTKSFSTRKPQKERKQECLQIESARQNTPFDTQQVFGLMLPLIILLRFVEIAVFIEKYNFTTTQSI